MYSLSALRQRWSIAIWAEERIVASLLQSGMLNPPHSGGRTLVDHLRGTRAMLAAWNQPGTIQLAGLCHSIYSTDRFRNASLSLEQRPRVRRLIGKKAEELAYLFGAVTRESLFLIAEETPFIEPEQRISVQGRPGFPVPSDGVTGRDVASLLVIHLANMAEQLELLEGLPPLWMSRFGRLAVCLGKQNSVELPLLDSIDSPLDESSEKSLRGWYIQACRQCQTDQLKAISCLTLALEICPFHIESNILLAVLLAQTGDASSAKAVAVRGLDAARLWNFIADKRMSIEEWRALGAHVLHDGSQTSLRDALARLSLMICKDDDDGSGPTPIGESDAARRVVEYLDTLGRNKTSTAARLYPGLSKKEFHQTSRFPVIEELERRFAAVLDEVNSLKKSLFQNEVEAIARSGEWKIFMLFESGRKVIENCSRVPVITEILERHDCVRRSGGLIYISKLTPQTAIAAHRGPTNMRLRSHLGIEVPVGDCGLRVGSKVTGWQTGKCIVFDDHFEHEVWNNTDRERIVLLIDVWHPDLTALERRILDGVQWLGYSQAISISEFWRRNDFERGVREESLDRGLDKSRPIGLLDENH